MEQLVLGIFQEQLAKVIIGFRNEQINASLLNGKGEIRDVSLNCSFFNDSIARVCPYIRMEEINVSRIGFHVTSWANLRKAPIIVDIGHITAKVQEPLSILPRNQRRRIQMITESELIQRISDGFKPLRGSGSYGLMDRIVDNLTIEIESFQFEFQTWGKFKTKRPGLWTPPLLQVEFTNLKVCMVDAEGSEGSPDSVWAHNRGRQDSFLTFKKVCGECQINLIPNYQTINQKDHSDLPFELTKLNMEIQIAVERRLRDVAVLACQLDMTIPEVEIDIDSTNIRLLRHFASGIQYCFAKDRSFDDPLKSLAESTIPLSSSSNPAVADLVARGDSVEVIDEVEEDSGSDEDDDDGDNILCVHDVAVERNRDGNSIHDDGSFISSCSEDGIAEEKNSSVTEDSFTRNNISKQSSSNRSESERSVILLPNGLIIYESICLTSSINNLVVWASYPGNQEKGCIEFVAKGCIAEAIWPKVDRGQGFYLQFSTSFLSLEERVCHHQRTLLLAGIQRDDGSSNHLPSRKPQDISADEFFPLFERRSLRDDPLDLRHSFPTQAVGLKTTIDVLNQSIDDETHDRFIVLHEVGGDGIQIILDTDVFVRLANFIMNVEGEGFDSRWDTGDWSDLLTPDMLHHPSQRLNLDECLQECKQLFLDENLMISSDLFNATARLSNVVMRVPSTVKDSLRSCDIMLKWKETTFIISSALPRTFLTGRIGNSISGDARHDVEKGIIDFPNDPSDICYKYEQGLSGKAISTFRLQLTTRGFELHVVPIITFCTAPESQKFVTISDSTMIFSFEGEPPTIDCERMKITVFLSILIQELILNIDFDILAGAMCTLLFHKKNIIEIIEAMIGTSAQSQISEPIFSKEHTPQLLDETRIKQSLKGRRILAGRHMLQSRETGGLAIVFCLQQKDLRLRVWRQNVPVRCPLREKLKLSGMCRYHDDEGIIDLLNLLDFEMKDLEVGIEFDFHSKSGHRTIVKSYLRQATLKVVDLAKEIEHHKLCLQRGESLPIKPTGHDDIQFNLIDLCSFGNETMPSGLNPSGLAQQFAFRLEAHHTNSAQSWSMAADISAPSTINLDLDAIKTSTLLIIEALLLPAWSSDPIIAKKAHIFPQGTTGAMFYCFATDLLGLQNFAVKDFENVEIDINSNDPILEQMLRSICYKFLPLNLQVILLRCEIANLFISIRSEDDNENKENKNVSFLFNQSDIIMRFYPKPGSPPSEIEQVLACKGIDWSTLINTKKEGFYQYICSRQSLFSMTEETEGAKLETVVHPFEIRFTYSGAEADLSMEKGISIDDVRLVENIQSKLKVAIKLSSEGLSDICSVVRAMIHRDTTEVDVSESPESVTQDIESSKMTSQQRNYSFLSKTLKLLRKASEEVRLYENKTRAIMLKKENELEAIKIDLFSKERERFGALSLLASRVAGWIRMGGQHRSGQRVVKKSLLWPFWAILRKELLVLYPRPGEPKPSDIVSLVDARIRELDGGNSRQDTKRGFAIVEKSGMIRYFVTSNAQEYKLWTNEINRAISLFSDSSKISDSHCCVDIDNSEIAVNGITIETNGDAIGQGNNRIGNRLSSAFHSARLKGKESSDKGQSTLGTNRRIEDDSAILPNDIQSNLEIKSSRYSTQLQNPPQSKRSEISKKFSEVGLVTKSRLGSAIQNARHKRDEIANKQKTYDHLSNNSEKDSESQKSLKDSPVVGVNDRTTKLGAQDGDGSRGSFRQRTGLQLGNKLGSAIHNARMKAKGNVEKQDRLYMDEGLIDHLPKIKTVDHDQTIDPISKPLEPLRNASDSIQSNIKRIDLIKQEGKNRRNYHFNFLKRNEDLQDDSLFGGELLTLKNIYAGQDITSPPSTSQVEFNVLAEMKEKWIVKVSEITNTLEVSAGIESNDYTSNSTDFLHDFQQKPRKIENEVKSKQENVSITSATLEVETDSIESRTRNDVIQNSIGEVGLVARDRRDGKELSDISDSKSQKATLEFEGINRNGVLGAQAAIPRLLVKILRVQHNQTVESSEKQLSFGDVSKLYSTLSEIIENTSSQLLGKYSSIWGETSARKDINPSQKASFENVMVCGRILAGILETRESFECIESFRRYRCESVENFFNYLLDCPLPVDGLKLLADTLGIIGITKEFQLIQDDSRDGSKRNSHDSSLADGCIKRNGVQEEVIRDNEFGLHTSGNSPGHILNLLNACEAELQRAEIMDAAFEGGNDIAFATNTKEASLIQLQPILYDPLLPPTLTDHIHKSIHKSLMGIMAERDEAHAQLIRAKVMHTNSLEQMRKKNERLEIDATFSQEIARVQLKDHLQTSNIASMFGRADERADRMRKEIEKKIEKVHQIIKNDDGEAEMMGLCSQLGAEISTKTSLALEVKRLKEIGETEKRIQASEKEALKDEIRRLQELLLVQQQKNSEACAESAYWKRLYEQCRGKYR